MSALTYHYFSSTQKIACPFSSQYYIHCPLLVRWLIYQDLQIPISSNTFCFPACSVGTFIQHFVSRDMILYLDGLKAVLCLNAGRLPSNLLLPFILLSPSLLTTLQFWRFVPFSRYTVSSGQVSTGSSL